MKLSKNFNREEFDCRDGTIVPDKYMENLKALVSQLQILRDDLAEPIRVISGYRTPSHNRRVGGAKQSQHLLAKAADITVKTLTPKQLKDRIETMIDSKKIRFGGIGLYAGFVHVDIRAGYARW